MGDEELDGLVELVVEIPGTLVNADLRRVCVLLSVSLRLRGIRDTGAAPTGDTTGLDEAETLGLGLRGLFNGLGGGNGTVVGEIEGAGVFSLEAAVAFLLVNVFIGSAVENSGMMGETLPCSSGGGGRR